MLYWLMLLCEVLLAGAAVTMTALWSMPAAVILGVFLCVALLFIRPALRTERVLRERARRVVHGKRLPRVEAQIPVRPSDLEGGEVARLFEGTGLLGERTARRSAACATLLSLDRRDILKIVMEEDKAMLLLPVSEQKERLAPYETALLRMFEKAAKGAQSVRLSVFREYASRHIRAMQHALDRADRALTERLLRRGLFVKKKVGKKSVLALSAKGAQQAALWREYYRYLCNAPARQARRSNRFLSRRRQSGCLPSCATGFCWITCLSRRSFGRASGYIPGLRRRILRSARSFMKSSTFCSATAPRIITGMIGLPKSTTRRERRAGSAAAGEKTTPEKRFRFPGVSFIAERLLRP